MKRMICKNILNISDTYIMYISMHWKLRITHTPPPPSTNVRSKGGSQNVRSFFSKKHIYKWAEKQLQIMRVERRSEDKKLKTKTKFFVYHLLKSDRVSSCSIPRKDTLPTLYNSTPNVSPDHQSSFIYITCIYICLKQQQMKSNRLFYYIINNLVKFRAKNLMQI